MGEHRRYTRRQKLTAVVAADMTSMQAASEATGIPITTIDYWMDRPEFVELRKNAREALAEEALTVARMAWGKLAEAIAANQLEPRDLVMAAGMATARTETRDISGTLNDADLADAIREAERLTTAGNGGAPEAAEGEAAG